MGTPLAELPRNHISSNGQVVRPKGALLKGKLLVTSQPFDENYPAAQESSTLKGMLKNTTEIGTVGQFASKSPRIPRPIPRQSPASSSVVSSTSTRRRRRPPYHDGINGQKRLQAQEPSRQGITSIRDQNFHTQRYREPPSKPSLDDFHPHTMTQNSYNSHSLTHRHPLINGYLLGRADVNHARPRSPYAYPTRLKRPGYRPLSPSLSDANKGVLTSRPGFVHEPSSRTATPSSAYNGHRTLSPSSHMINRSDPDLQHYPPYLAIRRPSPSVASSRPSTPKPSPSLTSMSSSSRIYRRISTRNSSRIPPKPPHVSPLFYDYTEEFEESGSPRGSNALEDMFTEQSVSTIEPHTYSEPAESPERTSLAKSPTEQSSQQTTSNLREVDQQDGSREVNLSRGTFMPTALQDLSDVPELSENEVAATNAIIPETPKRRTGTERSSTPSKPDLGATEASVKKEVVTDYEVDCSERLLQRSIIKANNRKYSRIPRQGARLPAESAFSAKSSSKVEPQYSTHEPMQALCTLRAPRSEPRVPVKEVIQAVSPSKTDGSLPSASLRAPSFEGHSRVSTEILSPTPERSITSPSNRDRFSKILSIDEGTVDEEPLVPPPKIEEKIATPTHRINSADLWKNSDGLEMFRRKRSLYSRNSPLKQSTPTGVLMEISDSDDEPELTVGLRRTFCKDDQPILSYRQSSSPTATVASPPLIPAPIISTDGVNQSSLQDSTVHGAASSGGERPSKADYYPAAVAVKPETLTTSDNGLSPKPKKQPSFRSYSPPRNSHGSDLPFDFSPLIRQPSEGNSTGDVKHVSSSVPEHPTTDDSEDPCKVVEIATELRSISSSVATAPGSASSRPTSRPWNQDSSYPWNDALPSLQVTIPPRPLEASKPSEKPPRFKFKVQRASSLAGTNKLRKDVVRPKDFSNSTALALDIAQGPSFLRKRNPNLSVLPGQLNSSHDVMHSSRQRAQFFDTFEAQSPTISLIPPSPNHEVHSCFSDDSSQSRPRRAFRRRLSLFKVKTAAARMTSLDEGRTHDRGLLNSALGRSKGNGRSSRQSQNTAGASTRTSTATRTRLRILDRIRWWFHRGEDRVRGWGWRMRYRNEKSRAASAPTYATS